MSLLAELVNPGQDFEDYYPDVTRVTVMIVNPDTGAVLNSAENVPAAKLVEVSDSAPARGGEVGVGSCEWWFRCDLLGFTPRPRCLLIQSPDAADEVTWILDDCEFSGVGGVNYLCKSKATRAR